ncbi:Hint domain-containing protein [Bradyrhizobium sp. WSM3983]|uniref:Hint domain-containing protein n=1 Tax=Bradyrhizobium sp. WSM3983 TaxID=1038867 RepID=UPI00040A4820|nr:Hint domain-containing protein [Bradyrhizobium sp. WSM3983]
MIDESGPQATPTERKSTTTRRQMLAGQAKALLAMGATVLMATTAKAAPRPPCFVRGTKLRSTDGELSVETIAVGDQLMTVSGAFRPVVWVGSWLGQKRAGESWSKQMRPVRIKQSALAPNVPYEDLLISQGHAIFIDGLLVPAGELVNGTTVLLETADESDTLEYFHVKLASHDMVLAAGAPVETLLHHPAATDLEGRRMQAGPYCAPVVCKGLPGVLWSRSRRIVTPLFGPQKLDVIRERLVRQPS